MDKGPPIPLFGKMFQIIRPTTRYLVIYSTARARKAAGDDENEDDDTSNERDQTVELFSCGGPVARAVCENGCVY